jgi:hypothetical protein
VGGIVTPQYCVTELDTVFEFTALTVELRMEAVFSRVVGPLLPVEM